MQIDLAPLEVKLLLRVLEDYSSELGNHGCNDMEVPNSPEMLAWVTEAETWALGEPSTPSFHYGEIMTEDYTIVDYLKHRIETQTKEV